MSRFQPGTNARDIVNSLDFPPDGLDNEFLRLARNNQLTVHHWERLVRYTYVALDAQVVAHASLVTRFPHHPAADFFVRLAGLPISLRVPLREAAEQLGTPPDALAARLLPVPCQGLLGMFAWLGVHATQAEAGMAVYTDLAEWYAIWGQLIPYMERADPPPPAPAVSVFRRFSTPNRELLDGALMAADDGLLRGDDPNSAREAALLAPHYLKEFWDVSAAGTEE
ncbi:hypothetical protein ACWEV3_37290 [Saccharopolyspora sp. NPDC003752]